MRKGGYREVWKVALPLLLSQACFVVMQFCDRIMLSRFSSQAIDAALSGGMLAFCFVCFFQAVASYAGTFVAQYSGAGDTRNAVLSAIQGCWLAIVGVVPILLMIPLGNWIISISGHPAGVVAYEKEYFEILMLGGFLSPLNGALGGYFTSTLRLRVNWTVNTAGCALNVLLNWVLIYGHWGFPVGGIRGAGYATLLSQGFMLAIFLAVFCFDRHVRTAWRELRFVRFLRPRARQLADILRFGMPNGIKLLSDIGAYTIFVLFTGRSGAASFTASNIAFSINNLAFAPLLGFGLAASTLVARYQGAGDPDTAMRTGNRTLLLSLFYMIAVGVTFVCMARFYFALFLTDDPIVTFDEVFAVGRPMLIIMAAWGIFDTVNIVIEQALAGAGDTRFDMVYVLITNWLLFIPGAAMLVYWNFGILALWFWMAIYVVIASAGLWIRWVRGAWKSNSLIASAKRTN